LVAVATVLVSACGEPPEQLPTSPPYVAPSSARPSGGRPAGLPPAGTPPPVVTAPAPTLPDANPALPPYAYPTGTTTPATTVSPTPTPSHAAKCPGTPTKAQILALINGKPGIPNAVLRVETGPYCSGAWSFTTVEITGQDDDELDPLMVLTTGKDSALTLVAAGSEVCSDRTQHDAPPGIRVLACGF
jgi:hypothetical protein